MGEVWKRQDWERILQRLDRSTFFFSQRTAYEMRHSLLCTQICVKDRAPWLCALKRETRRWTHTHTHAHTHTHKHTHTHTYTHTPTHKHAHTYMHTHTHTEQRSRISQHPTSPLLYKTPIVPSNRRFPTLHPTS